MCRWELLIGLCICRFVIRNAECWLWSKTIGIKVDIIQPLQRNYRSLTATGQKAVKTKCIFFFSPAGNTVEELASSRTTNFLKHSAYIKQHILVGIKILLRGLVFYLHCLTFLGFVHTAIFSLISCSVFGKCYVENDVNIFRFVIMSARVQVTEKDRFKSYWSFFSSASS